MASVRMSAPRAASHVARWIRHSATDPSLRVVRSQAKRGRGVAAGPVGLAALADGPSRFRGIGHLRGHETDRVAALAAELTALGAEVEEHDDGLTVHPARLAAGRPWRASADHRMATTGALLGLAVPGLVVDDIGATTKTLPDFVGLWSRMLQGGAA